MRSMHTLLSRTGYVTVAAVLLGLAPSAAEAQMSFFPVNPCRLWDTRGPTGPAGGPAHSANSTRDFQVRGLCGIPSTAQAAVLNLTVTFGPIPMAQRDFGNLRAFPAGGSLPTSSVLNFVQTDPAVANGTVNLLGEAAGMHISIRIDMPVGSTGMIHSLADITGYFQ
jgi:hypothetical protein